MRVDNSKSNIYNNELKKNSINFCGSPFLKKITPTILDESIKILGAATAAMTAATVALSKKEKVDSVSENSNSIELNTSVATVEDLKEIQKIDLEAFKDRYDILSDFEEYKEDLEEQDIKTYVLKDKNKNIIGYYQLEPVEDGELYVYSMGVKKDLRVTRVSYAALAKIREEIIEQAVKTKATTVSLTVASENKALVNLYKKFGFKIVEESVAHELGREFLDYEMEIDVDEYFSEQKKRLSANPIVREKMPDAILNLKTIPLISKVLSDKRLYENNELTNAVNIITYDDWMLPEEFSAKKAYLDKYISDRRLYENELLQKDWSVLFSICDREELAATVEMIDRILSDEELYNNELIKDNFSLIIYSKNSEACDLKFSLINKIIKNKNLRENENVKRFFADVIKTVNYENQYNFILKILSDEKLYNNSMLLKNIDIILFDMEKSNEITEVKNSILDIYIDNSINNECSLDDEKFNRILVNARFPMQVQLLELILKEGALDEKQTNFLLSVLHNVKSEVQYELAMKILHNQLLREKLINVSGVMLSELFRHIEYPQKSEFIYRIMEDEKILSDDNIFRTFYGMIPSINNEQKSVFVDKILEKEWFYTNKFFLSNASLILGDILDDEILNARLKYLEICENNENFQQDFIKNVFVETAALVNSEWDVDTKTRIIKKVMSDEKIANNNTVQDALVKIVTSASTPEEADNVVNKIDIIINDKEVYNNPVLDKCLGPILQYGKNLSASDIKVLLNIFKSAFEKKDRLRAAGREISDKIIVDYLGGEINSINNAVKLVGEANFIQSFNMKLHGVIEFARAANMLMRQSQGYTQEQLLRKFNPENSYMYFDLKNTVKNLKKTYPDVKASGDEVALKNLQNQIATNTKQMQELRKNKPNLSPQRVLEKVRVLSAIAQTDISRLNEFIELIKDDTKENELAWKEKVNRLIFDFLSVDYDEKLSKRLNLIESRYLAEILLADEYLKNNLKKIIVMLSENPNLSNAEIFNKLPQNIETKKIFELLGLDYDKWSTVDKNSFVKVQVELTQEETQRAAIEALEKEFKNIAFTELPKEETDKIITALNDKGFELRYVDENIWDDFGFPIRALNVTRLYKNNQPIRFEDLGLIMKTIKQAINENPFWTTSTGNIIQDSYKDTVYNHLMKDRYFQYKSAKGLKSDKIVDIEVRKTDMNNISHALFLGNHGACCTAVGTGVNQYSASTYIKNKMVSAIEVVDGDNFVGNTMCYIAMVDGVPSLILDNIELKAEYQNNNTIRDAFIEYSKKLCAEIGKPDMPIYAGPYRHKLNLEIFEKEIKDIQLVGSTAEDPIYLDFMSQGYRIDSANIFKDVHLYKIR